MIATSASKKALLEAPEGPPRGIRERNSRAARGLMSVILLFWQRQKIIQDATQNKIKATSFKNLYSDLNN